MTKLYKSTYLMHKQVFVDKFCQKKKKKDFIWVLGLLLIHNVF